MIIPGAAMGLTDTVFKDQTPTNPDSITAVLWRWVSGVRSASGVAVTPASTGVAGVYTFTWTNDGGWNRTDDLELEARPVFSDKNGGNYIPVAIWRSHGDVDAVMRGTESAAQAGDAMTLTAAYDAAKTAAQAGDAMTLTGSTRTKLDATQPDYAPAKAGDEMTLDSATLTALFADVDVAALVASVVANFDEATDLPVQTLAALAASETVAALSALISDAAAAKAAAEANQTTLATVATNAATAATQATASATSAATAATQATAAATSAASADGKLSTARLAKIDGAMQTGADGDTGETLSDQIDGITLGGGTGDASQSTLLAVQSAVTNIGAQLAGTPIQPIGGVAAGGTLVLYVDDDLTVRSGTQKTIPVSDPTGDLYTKLSGLGVAALDFGAARQDGTPGEISGIVKAITQDATNKLCNISIEIRSAATGMKPRDGMWQIQQSQTHGTETDDAIELEGELQLRRRTVLPRG